MGVNFIIKLFVYPIDIMVSFGETDKALTRRLSKYDLGEDPTVEYGGTQLAYTRMYINCQTLMRFKNTPNSIKDYAVIAHEIFHAASLIMGKIGMPLELYKSDEAYAYLIEYITFQVYDNLRILNANTSRNIT